MDKAQKSKLILAVTQEELADCIARHERDLAGRIRDAGTCPADGHILTIYQTIAALKSVEAANG